MNLILSAPCGLFLPLTLKRILLCASIYQNPVIALLMELYHCNMGKYVISGADGINPISDKSLPKAIIRLQERIGIPKWTAHDLRRTFATQLGETLRIDPVVIEKCLGHKMPKIMATYNKNEMLPERQEALDQWANHIERLVTVEDKATIHSIWQRMRSYDY